MKQKLSAENVFAIFWQKGTNVSLIRESKDYDEYLVKAKEYYEEYVNHANWPDFGIFFRVFGLRKEEYEAIVEFAEDFFNDGK